MRGKTKNLMNLDTNNDPYLMEAAQELDDEFPGADYDDSLQEYLFNKLAVKELKRRKNKIVKKIIFHAVFYSAFVIGIHFLFIKNNTSVFSSMVYGLVWFLFYFGFIKSILIYTEKQQ